MKINKNIKTWQNRNKFNWALNTILGYYGEMLVKNSLRKKGYSVLSDNSPIRHSFDFLTQYNKYEFQIVEVKVCEELKGKYEGSNGINYGNYCEYIRINKENNMPFTLIWVDASNSAIYGNDFNILTGYTMNTNGTTYPRKLNTKYNGDKMLLSLNNVIEYDKLTEEELKNIETIKEMKKKVIILQDELTDFVYNLFKNDLEYLNIFFDIEDFVLNIKKNN